MIQILVGDLHFGNKNCSRNHLNDLHEFFTYLMDWCVDNYKDEKLELVVLGDTFHQRDKLAVEAFYAALKEFGRLSQFFDKITMLVGNHDMPYRDRRDVHSIEMFRNLPNVTVVDDYLIRGNQMYVSWLLNGEEYDDVIRVSKEYGIRWMYGHFEFSQFKMNDHYTMTHGQTHRELKHVEWVFTGHYHMHQIKDNVEYIGTPFPYDMNDANDFDRGFVVFDPETGEKQRVIWEGVTVLSMNARDLLEHDWENMNDSSVRIVIDEDISEEELETLKGKLNEGGFRESKIVHKVNKAKEVLDQDVEIKEPQNIDKLVLESIEKMSKVDGVEPDLLKKLYIQAKETQA